MEDDMQYGELMRLTVKQVQAFLFANPGHIAAMNALRSLEDQGKHDKYLARLGRKMATVSGRTSVRRKGRAPTKRDLR